MSINMPPIHLTKALPIPPLVVTIWSGVKDRVVAVITRMPVLAGMAGVGGIIFGAAAVWCIDYFFQNKLPELAEARYNSNYSHQMFRGERIRDIDKPSPAEKNLEYRLKTIFGMTISALLFSREMVLAAWKTCSNFNFFSLAIGGVGFALGAQLFENYKRNSERQQREFIRWLRQIDKNYSGTGWRLDLSYYCGYLRYFNLMQHGREFYRTFGKHKTPCHVLVFRGCRLTDADLKALKEGEWFSLFPNVNISDNPQLTAAGLKWVGEGGGEKLRILDLSRTNLTDEDLIQMAVSGCFKNLEELIIRDNPRLTGKGLACIGESGFEKLKMLDIGGNSQVLGRGLDEWIGKGGFNNLKALGLGYTDITEQDLQQMIDRSEWFRNLEGLDLDDSAKLKKLPANIKRMTQLSTHGTGRDDAGYYQYFKGQGLFVRDFSKDFELTPEFRELYESRKIIVTFQQLWEKWRAQPGDKPSDSQLTEGGL